MPRTALSTHAPWLAALLLAACAAHPAPAQDRPRDPTLTAQAARKIANEALDAFRSGDFQRAEELLRSQLELQPAHPIALYNLASVASAQGRHEEALELLLDAVQNGFDDLHRLRTDPLLRRAREQDRFNQLLDRWPEVLRMQAENNVLAVNRLFQADLAQTRDEDLRLIYLSAFDETSTAQAREEITKVARWARAFLPPPADPQADPDPWVVVVLPQPPQFLRWARSKYGEAAVSLGGSVGGEYDHATKRLISRDLGSSLRHEFMHVLHWRDITRRGQLHPTWVMEGLCSLAEDYDTAPYGRLSPAPSWRSNIAKRLERSGRLRRIADLTALTQEQFLTTRPLSNYAQARTLFLYLSDKGVLPDWYRLYTDNFEADPRGLKAFETVFEKPLPQIDLDYRAWLRDLPEAAEQIRPGMASLGIEADNGKGEGPIVAVIERRERDFPLKKGDVIVAIDGKPVRDLPELVRVLAGYEPDDQVELSVRRRDNHLTFPVRLVPR